MPIISAGIVSKQGRIILSRQFMDITRIRCEGLLSAFPKLLNSDGSAKQSTIVETSAVRYVYQPVEDLLLVLVTTKNSNIVEDLTTLRMLGRVIPECDTIMSEDSLSDKAFEICFAFDEVITGGHRENVTMEQIVTYLKMESHEEQLAIEEKKRQLELAKKEARKREAEIRRKRREGQGYGGIGAGSSSMGGGMGGGMGPTIGADEPAPASKFSDEAVEVTPEKPKARGVGGMSLGKGRKKDLASKALQEAGVAPIPSASAAPASAPVAAASTDAMSQKGVHIKIEEKVTCEMNRDGGINGNVDIRGDLTVHVADANFASVRINLAPFNDAFTYKNHPNINKAAFASDRVLAIKDNKPYPVMQQLSILKWRCANAGAIRPPLSITLWPGETSASIEYELESDLALENVIIAIPLSGAFPEVEECSEGSYAFDPNSGYLQWQIPEITPSNASGSMSINLNKEVADDGFFPTQIAFSSAQTFAGVSVNDVISLDTGMPVPYSSECALTTDSVQVV